MINGFLGRVVVDEIFCWTDPRVAFSWIWGIEMQWVENLVVSIRKIVDRTTWHFVRDEENPADIPTRIAMFLWLLLLWFAVIFLEASSSECSVVDNDLRNLLNVHQSVTDHCMETTLVYVRRKYWIVRGKKTINEILRKCMTCTRYQGVTVKPPSSPDLPDYRVDYFTYAFHTIGLDFAGPLFVNEGVYSASNLRFELSYSSRVFTR